MFPPMSMPSPAAMLTHAQIWAAIDALAARAGTSPSGLAKRAGLDPTTFNKSKRVTPDQRQRWPSTESVAKCLAATSTTVDQFVALMGASARGPARTVPMIGFAQAGEPGYFDARGFPEGDRWDETGFPAIEDRHAYALEISGDVLACELKRKTAKTIELKPLDPAQPDRLLASEDCLWIARIMWAGQ